MTEQQYADLLGPEATDAARDAGREAPAMSPELVDALRVLVAGHLLCSPPRDAA